MSVTRLLLLTVRIFFLYLLLVYSNTTAAQTCTPNYQKTYGGDGSDEGMDIFYTADGGSIIAGRTTSSSSNMNGFLMKTNSQGSIQWTKSFGSTEHDELLKVIQTKDGGYIAAGNTRSFGQQHGETWLVRVDGSGNLLWSKRVSSNGLPASVKAILQLPDSGFALAWNNNDSTYYSNFSLARFDHSGSLLWDRTYDNGGADGITSLVFDGTHLVIGGFTMGGNKEGFVLKADLNDGSVAWAQKLIRFEYMDNEVIRIDTITNGYMVAMLVKQPVSTFNQNNPQLCFVKIVDNVATHLGRRYHVSTGTGYDVSAVNLAFSGDSSVVFSTSDNSPARNAVLRKLGIRGVGDGFGLTPNQFAQHNTFLGIVPFENKGYLFAGTLKNFENGLVNKVQVIKTDWRGDYGSCASFANVMHEDTIKQLSITTLPWLLSFTQTVQIHPVVPDESNLAFTERVLCERQDCVPEPATNNDGCHSTFLAEYWDKYQLVPFEVVKVADGYIMAGYNKTSIQPFVLKVAVNGTVAWSKSVGSEFFGGSFQHVRLTEDGNVLLAGPGGYTVDHYGYSITAFVKMSPSGDIIWSSYVQGSIADLQQSGNNTFTGLLHYNMEQEPVSVIKFVMDANGNLTYRKRLNERYEILPTFRRIVLEGNAMYGAGEFNGSVFVERFDTAGQRTWSRRFVPDDKFSKVDGLFLNGDSVYVMVRINRPVGWTGRQFLGMVKVSKDGEGLNGVMLDQELAPDTHMYHFWLQTQNMHTAITKDGNFILADRIPGTPDSALAIFKFTPTGQVLWAKKYPAWKQHKVSAVQDDSAGILVLGHRLYLGDTYDGSRYSSYHFNPILIRASDEGEVDPGSDGSCESIPFSTTMVPLDLPEPFVYRPTTPNFDWMEGIEKISYQTDARLLNTIPTTICGVKGNCSKIEISGPANACIDNNIVAYKAQRNLGCDVPVTWSFDPSIIDKVSGTDSELSVIFKRAGITKIYSSISTPCGRMVDSIVVTILTSANQLTLGADTTLCPGNTILLKAQNGFTSYRWQDGSTDPTYLVNTPGVYHVTVEDACGKSFTDFINVTEQPPIPFDVSPDRTKCGSDTIQFKAPDGFLSYSWSPSYAITAQSGQAIIVNPSVDTTYFVKAEKTPGCFAFDTIRVKVYHAPPIQLGQDLSFCQGESRTLDAGSGFSSYVWNTNATTQQLTVQTAGQYIVTGITDKGCRASDTLTVLNAWTLPVVNLDKNAELCTGTTRTLNAGNFSAYQWQDGSTSRNFTISGPGRYYVTVTDAHGCTGSDTTEITTLLPLPAGFLFADTAICSYSKIQLQPTQGYQSYLWSTGGTTKSITIEKPNLYWLQVEDAKGCIGRDSIVITQKDCMNGVYIPTAITPNRDGKNDEFSALVFGKTEKFELTVYNRWGQVIFYTVDPRKGWDGKLAGLVQETSVYVWTCRYQLQGGKEVIEKGTVTVVR
ncbi:MAG TPA: gliding motility-associated C-terminal domain-containing protein [Flavisolibacter sp.]|jgi:gliding motility-associated-like protein|nr:gliding motility-associated C-terminal domain-containing protein [Flavisolibacter sp.]